MNISVPIAFCVLYEKRRGSMYGGYFSTPSSTDKFSGEKNLTPENPQIPG